MPKENPYLIKENYKQVEEVREIENKNQVEEIQELKETEQEKVERSYEEEFDSYDNIEVEKGYGPGNEESKAVAKKVGSVALATTYFTPLGAVTAPMTAVAAGTGGAMWVVGKGSDNNDLKEAGGLIFGTAFDAAVDGLSAGTLSASAPAIAKLTKEVCKVISELGDMKDKIEALERHGVYIPMELTPQQRADFVNHILKYGL